MKKVFLFASFVTLALSASAQIDITPEHFKFDKWPVGAVSSTAGEINCIDFAGKDRLNVAKVTESLNRGGLLQLMQFSFSDPAHADIATIKSGLSVVNLGDKVGNALCFKGNQSTYAGATIAAPADLAVPSFTLAFYLDPAKTITGKEQYYAENPGGNDTEYGTHAAAANTARANAIIRTTVVFKIIDNNIDIENKNNTVNVKISLGNGSIGATGSYSNFNFTKREMDEETGEQTVTYEENQWLEVSTDAYVNQDPAKPYTLWFEVTSGTDTEKFSINKKTVLIKSIKMTNGYRLGDKNFYPSLDKVGTDPNGFTTQNQNTTLPLLVEKVELGEGGSVNTEVINTISKPFYSVSGNQVTLNNLKSGELVTIYSFSGQAIKKFAAQNNNATITLKSGYYIARIGKESLKFVVY